VTSAKGDQRLNDFNPANIAEKNKSALALHLNMALEPEARSPSPKRGRRLESFGTFNELSPGRKSTLQRNQASRLRKLSPSPDKLLTHQYKHKGIPPPNPIRVPSNMELPSPPQYPGPLR
jgi:hypothetical protein